MQHKWCCLAKIGRYTWYEVHCKRGAIVWSPNVIECDFAKCVNATTPVVIKWKVIYIYNATSPQMYLKVNPQCDEIVTPNVTRNPPCDGMRTPDVLRMLNPQCYESAVSPMWQTKNPAPPEWGNPNRRLLPEKHQLCRHNIPHIRFQSLNHLHACKSGVAG